MRHAMRHALVVVVAASGVLALVTSGHASSSRSVSVVASRVADRTYACSIRRSAEGYPDPFVSRSIGVRLSLSNRNWPGSVGVSDNNPARPVPVLFEVLLDAPPAGGRSGGVRFSRRQCTWLRGVRVPLVRTGLAGPPTRLDRGFDCAAPARVLIRVRVVLQRPASWVTVGEFVAVSSKVREALVAVRTLPSRRPLAFASVTADEGELYVSRVSPRCVED